MILNTNNLGKRFNKEWIFKDFTYTFNKGESYAIIGANGSGKSTLLQTLAGIIPASQGHLEYQANNTKIPIEESYKYITFLSPFQELIEELTLKEFLIFHLKFKKLENTLTIDEFVNILTLSSSINKPIQYFSSGMKQRVKLGLALFCNSDMILLDEPTVNLDEAGIQWFDTEVKKQLGKKIIIVCSNQKYEYTYCDHIISINDYKNKQ